MDWKGSIEFTNKFWTKRQHFFSTIFHFSVTLRLSKLTEKDYDENLIYLLG